MTIVYRKLVEALKAEETYGYITEADRETLDSDEYKRRILQDFAKTKTVRRQDGAKMKLVE